MGTVTIEVRYFAAARAASGVEAEKIQLADGATIDDVLAALRVEHGTELACVLQRCSYLLDEVAVRDRGLSVTGASTLDVLPPFAGG